MKHVAITSWAARTPLGDGSVTWQRLLQGHHIDDHARFADLGDCNRAANLAGVVAEAATSRRPLDADAAVIVGTSKGAIEDWLHRPAATFDPTSDNPKGRSSIFGLGGIASTLSGRFRTGGPLLTLSAACASGLHALVRGAMMIRAGEVRQALIVATEASVHPLFLGSFQRLGILARPGAGCRPFDETRTGFYMSEAASAVVLEAVDDAELSDGQVFVDRFALGGDATHVTGGDPAAKVLRNLLGRVIDGRPVDLIHAHGTGTDANDAVELSAIDDAVGDDWSERPVVYSHKAALGHSLGASGLLGVVLNCMSHAHGVIPPNPLTTRPLPAGRVSIPNVPTHRAVRRSLAIAAGFGGPTAVVSLAGR